MHTDNDMSCHKDAVVDLTRFWNCIEPDTVFITFLSIPTGLTKYPRVKKELPQ